MLVMVAKIFERQYDRFAFISHNEENNMSARTRATRRKADRLFVWHGNYTFRQISVSYKYWLNVLKRSENKSKIHFGLAKS